MDLLRNMLIEWVDDNPEPRTERIVWISAAREIVVTFDIFAPTAWPVVREYHEVESAIDDGTARILTVDPYATWNLPEEEIPAVRREHRDVAYDSIVSLVENPEVFIRRLRGNLVRAVAEEVGCAERTIRRRLRRWWQRGLCRNALLPDFQNCGGTGNEYLAEHATKIPKRGRPSDPSVATGETMGVNVTAKIKDLLLRGARIYTQHGHKGTFTT